ncbi:MAG: MBL fold metallo-hydrolase [Verrucomicrobia bacterium]|nr:MBL fold metallo-hydrolase [Verrucomicrobiota bacterium]MBI3867839.1 MBL fold metallo-hydrolase [Verrucomicrobiota bacterium]
MKTILSLAVFLCMTSLATMAQRNFDVVQIKTTEVAGNIHMLEGSGGNIAVSVGLDGALMVDTQFAPLGGKIAAAIEALGHGQPKFVINTHSHGDHTGGNARFGTNASIVAHHNVRVRLSAQSGTEKAALPKVTYGDAMSMHFNGEEIRLIHIGPGHTDGDTIIHFTQSGVFHLGDLFFNGKFPFVDQGSGGSVEGEMKNVQAALKLIPENAKIIPGHGPLATRADLVRFEGMLTETVGVVRSAIKEGKTLADVQTAGLDEKWKDWGTGFINTRRWLEIVYNNLTQK